jgi:hypothetical protein
MTSSNLDLDPKNMLGHFLFVDHFKSEHTQWKQMQKGRFVTWANHILELYAGKKVDSFRVEYLLGSDCVNDKTFVFEFLQPESSSKFQCLKLLFILLNDKDIFKSRECG